MEAVEATASITDVIIEDNRRRHVTLLLSERYICKKHCQIIYIFAFFLTVLSFKDYDWLCSTESTNQKSPKKILKWFIYRGSWNHNLDSTDSKLHAKEVGSYRGRLLKRTIKRSKSVMGIFVSSKSSSSNFDTYKAKNIKQVYNSGPLDFLLGYFN